MAFARYLSVLALALWVGGLVALGALAAPGIFSVLEAQTSAGPELGGQVFEVIFANAQHAAWGCGLVVFVSLAVRAALGPRPRRLAIRLWSVTGMVALSAISSVVLVPRIDAIRRNVAGSIAALPAIDPRAVSFHRLHNMASAFMAVTIVVGAALIWAELMDRP
jgi:Domain of unknown function (DUF4149)